jgi:hypothetical protein
MRAIDGSVIPSKSLPSPSKTCTPELTIPAVVLVLVDAAVMPKPLGIAMFNVPSFARKLPFASALTVSTMSAPELVTEYFAAIAVFALSPAASALATSVAVLADVVNAMVTSSGDPVSVDPVTVKIQFPLDVAPAAAITVAVST